MWWLTAQTCDLSSHLACISWVTSSDLAFLTVKGNTPNSYQMPHHEDEMETLRRDCYYLLFWSVLPDPTSQPQSCGYGAPFIPANVWALTRPSLVQRGTRSSVRGEEHHP